MQLDAIRDYVKNDLEIVDQIIAEYLGTDITLIRQLGEHIFGSGGKRLRPTLVLLSAKAFAYSGDQHYLLAAIVELIHTATLLHDDVVDASNLRRGKKTANNIWGNEASVLVGDYLYSRSFQMMVKVGSMEILSVLADASNTIAEGEVLQLMNVHQPEVSEENYLKVICAKTAMLFEASAKLGALLCQRSTVEITAMANYGKHIGIAFQLIDDALDYGSSNQDIGKNIGDDLAEGKPTLPLIYALKNGTTEQQDLIRYSIKNGSIENLAALQEAIESTKAIAYTYELAKKHINMALESLTNLPPSPARNMLTQLAEFAIARQF